MIIVYQGYGNHSNRLFQNVFFESFCIEYNIPFSNTSFSDMSKYYISGGGGYNILFSIKCYLLKRKIVRYFIKNVIDVDEGDQDKNIDKIKSMMDLYKNIYVSGWMLGVPELIDKYQDYFISKYTLREIYYKNNKTLKKIIELKNANKIVVAVHIRRGDYKEFHNGKWYFSDMVYIKYMQVLEKEIDITLNMKCIFAIFSNENTSFKNANNILISNNQWYIDHYLMSQCDYLIGPPSTFTLWASYIGKKKYFHIEDDSGNVSLDMFKEIKHF